MSGALDMADADVVVDECASMSVEQSGGQGVAVANDASFDSAPSDEDMARASEILLTLAPELHISRFSPGELHSGLAHLARVGADMEDLLAAWRLVWNSGGSIPHEQAYTYGNRRRTRPPGGASWSPAQDDATRRLVQETRKARLSGRSDATGQVSDGLAPTG